MDLLYRKKFSPSEILEVESLKHTYRNVHIVEPETGTVAHDQAIVVENGLIMEVSAASSRGETTDLKGLYVTPGLIDAHVHLVWEGQADPVRHMLSDPPSFTAYRAARSVRRSLQNGVTTVRDVGGPHGVPVALSRAVREGVVEGADVLAAGAPIVMTGGHVYTMSREADGVDEVRKAVREEIKSGAGLVKIMASGGAYTPGESIHATQMAPDEIQAAVDEAHRAHRRIAAHALNAAAIGNVLTAGVDTVEHGALANDDNIFAFSETGAYLIPTLSPYFLMAQKGEEMGVPDYAVAKSKNVMEHYAQTMQRAVAADINIGLGTDAGSPGIPHACVAFEAWIWERVCGLEPRRILYAATLGAAGACGLEDRGRLAAGARADWVAFETNPLEDIYTLHHPKFVLKEGQPCPNVSSAWSHALVNEF